MNIGEQSIGFVKAFKRGRGRIDLIREDFKIVKNKIEEPYS